MPHGGNGSGQGGFMGLFNPFLVSEIIDFFFPLTFGRGLVKAGAWELLPIAVGCHHGFRLSHLPRK